jgi:hypothetical protein
MIARPNFFLHASAPGGVGLMIGNAVRWPTEHSIAGGGTACRFAEFRHLPGFRPVMLQRARVLAGDSTYPSEAICRELARLMVESHDGNQQQS